MRYRIDWLEVGKEIIPDPISQEFFLDVIKLIDKGNHPHEWDTWLAPGCKLPFSQGYAIKTAIEGFRFNHVTGVCYSNNWMDGCLFGVRGTFQKAGGKLHTVDLFAIDQSTDVITPICARVWEGVKS